MSPPRVLITGFMGAGKTTVGRALAARLGVRFADLDDAVREAEGRGPRELIDEEGEERFRAAETRALRRVLEAGSARVVATGGGAWALERNRALAAAHGCLSVWLDAPYELCRARVGQGGPASERPLFRDPARARSLYEQRLAAYGLADLRVAVGPDDSPESLAAAVASALGGAA